jgi:hypothetical protein
MSVTVFGDANSILSITAKILYQVLSQGMVKNAVLKKND